MQLFMYSRARILCHVTLPSSKGAKYDILCLKKAWSDQQRRVAEEAGQHGDDKSARRGVTNHVDQSRPSHMLQFSRQRNDDDSPARNSIEFPPTTLSSAGTASNFKKRTNFFQQETRRCENFVLYFVLFTNWRANFLSFLTTPELSGRFSRNWFLSSFSRRFQSKLRVF
jgi:hypothetical protein